MAPVYQAPFQPRFRLAWIGESWRYFSAQAGNWIVTALLLFVISVVANAILNTIFGTSSVIDFNNTVGGDVNAVVSHYRSAPDDVAPLVGLVISSYFLGGIYQMANAQVRGQAIDPGMMFQGYKVYPNMLGYHLMVSVLTFIGLVLCIVPGLIVLVLAWPGYALVADGVPVGEAISRSIDIAKRDMPTGLGLAIVYGLLVLVSVLPCGLGLFITVPMGWLLPALMYRDMIGMPFGATAGAAFASPPPQPGVWPPPPTAPAVAPEAFPQQEPPTAPPEPPQPTA